MCHHSYPVLRASLAPEYSELSDEQLDALVAEMYGPGVSAEDIESFWRDVGKGFKRVGKTVGRALPSIAQGAMTGASVGGPWGALAGAVAGGAGGILSQSRNKTLRGIGGAIGSAGKLAGNFTGGGALRGLAGSVLGGAAGRGGLGRLAGGALGALQGRGGAGGALGQLAGGLAPQLANALGGRGGSAGALLGMLSRPETVRALSAAALGPAGRSQLPIGGQAVPVQSILGALGNLAGRAASEAEAYGDHPAYFYRADGELAIDPADAEQRTLALLELYAETTSPYESEAFESDESDESYESDESDESSDYDEALYTDEDAVYDEWLLANESAWSEYEEEESHA